MTRIIDELLGLLMKKTDIVLENEYYNKILDIINGEEI